MEHEKRYERVRFSEKVIRDAAGKFDDEFGAERKLEVGFLSLSVDHGYCKWRFDREQEFFLAYGEADAAAYLRRLFGDGRSEAAPWAKFNLHYHNSGTDVTVEANHDCKAGDLRAGILSVFQIFDQNEDSCRLPCVADDLSSSPVVFIGHGHNSAWRDLKDHLTDKHHYSVEAYETGARAGHTIRDILESMLDSSDFALLVLTKEDQMADGMSRGRQNVIHEAGLFQGKLGFSKAIMLVEEGIEDFSNIQGIEQIRFTRIQEAFGELVATLKREFD